MNYNLFKGKKVLVTGHTGFIGSWSTRWLIELGAEIMGFSLDPPSIPNLYNILNIVNQIEETRVDVTDEDSLRNAIIEFQPEIVFHLAAQPLVLESYNNPKKTFETNVMGTVNLLECLRKTGSVKTIIVMTSDKVYRNDEKAGMFVETDPLGGLDPYSASKSSQDVVVNSFRQSYFSKNGVSVSSVRAGNVIGGGDWGKDRLIPDIVRGLTTNNHFTLRNPESTRPWQYVLDLISGLFHLAWKMQGDVTFGADWNFGPLSSQFITVREIAEKAISIFGTGEYSVVRSNTRKEATYLRLDSNKARRSLSWLPRYDFDSGLTETLAWYKKYYQRSEEMDTYTKSLINRYVEILDVIENHTESGLKV